MKAIQITLEEDLLRELDADALVNRIGRSALLRGLTREYLRRKREQRIDEAYARAYGVNSKCDQRWTDWEEQGHWPDEGLEDSE